MPFAAQHVDKHEWASTMLLRTTASIITRCCSAVCGTWNAHARKAVENGRTLHGSEPLRCTAM